MKFRTLSLAGASALALISAGCGASSNPTRSVLALPFGSPALARNRVIPAHFKCNARNVWLPLQWGEPPANTQELTMYIARFGAPKQVQGKVTAEVKATAVVVGIKPTMRKLSLGKYPQGVLIGVHAPNNSNASICPPRGSRQSLLFRIYALPHKLGISKATHNEGENLVNNMREQAIAAGTFIATYKPA